MISRLSSSRAVFALTIWFSAGLSLFPLWNPTKLVAQQSSFERVVEDVQPKMVKIQGSGGFRGLEPYQSGMIISADGHILTVWSYVLDSDVITVTLNDGQRYEASLVGYDPRLEIAVLKIPAKELPFFNIEASVTVNPGARVLAFSNLYGVASGNEPASVLRGVVSARSELTLRRGAFESNYQGEVYVIDAMTNNPGAAGGAVTNSRGQLAGLIGKELKDAAAGTWLNFALPIEALVGSILDIRSGKMIVRVPEANAKPGEPMSLELIGMTLLPEVVSRTPPFIDAVQPDSAAQNAGLQSDDLIVEINGTMTPTRRSVLQMLSNIDRDETVNLTIQRGRRFLRIELDLNQ